MIDPKAGGPYPPSQKWAGAPGPSPLGTWETTNPVQRRITPKTAGGPYPPSRKWAGAPGPSPLGTWETTNPSSVELLPKRRVAHIRPAENERVPQVPRPWGPGRQRTPYSVGLLPECAPGSRIVVEPLLLPTGKLPRRLPQAGFRSSLPHIPIRTFAEIMGPPAHNRDWRTSGIFLDYVPRSL